MRKILASGYYGMKNYGDDLFGVVAANAAKTYWSNYDIELLCPAINDLKSKYSVPGFFPRELYSSQQFLGKISRLGFLAKSVLSAEKYLFCGGSLFSSSQSGARNFISKLNSNKLKLSAVGVSIGPFNNSESERNIKELLKRFEYIALRDRASYEIAKNFELDCPVVMAGDLAGLMPKYYPVIETQINRDEKVIGFSPCNLPENRDLALNYCDSFISAIESINKEVNVKVIILNLNAHKDLGDYELCKYVEKKLINILKKVELVSYYDFGAIRTWSLIASFDAYVSVRLHGAISAFLLNVPFALFEYHPKCTEFLQDVGKDESLFINYKSECNMQDIIFKLLSKKEIFSQPVDNYKKSAELNFICAPWANT